MIENFSLERVNQAPGQLRPDEAASRSRRSTCATLPLAEKVAGVLPFLERAGLGDSADRRRHARVRRAHRRGAGRSDQGVRRHPAAGVVLLRASDESTFDEKAFAKRVLAPGAVDRLADYRGWLRRPARRFDAAALEQGDAGADGGERAWAWATSCTPCASPSPACRSARACSTACRCWARRPACAASTGPSQKPAPPEPALPENDLSDQIPGAREYDPGRTTWGVRPAA